MKNFTVKEETVDDAVLAAQLLMKTPNINPKKVFVLGHSLGGYLIPRIGEKEKAIAGLVSLAGSTRPLEDMIIEQYEYIFGFDGTISPAEQLDLLHRLGCSQAQGHYIAKPLPPSEFASFFADYYNSAKYRDRHTGIESRWIEGYVQDLDETVMIEFFEN